MSAELYSGMQFWHSGIQFWQNTVAYRTQQPGLMYDVLVPVSRVWLEDLSACLQAETETRVWPQCAARRIGM
jgi:hypothetical protein